MDDIKNLLLLIASSQVHTEAMTYNLLYRRPYEMLTDLEDRNDFHIVDQNVNYLLDLTKELKGEVLLNTPLEQKVEKLIKALKDIQELCKSTPDCREGCPFFINKPQSYVGCWFTQKPDLPDFPMLWNVNQFEEKEKK